MTTESLIPSVRKAWAARQGEAEQAHALFKSYCSHPLASVSGMDTVLRLALRIDNGRSVEEAAAREYLFRWSLALKSPGFDIPHPLGL